MWQIKGDRIALIDDAGQQLTYNQVGGLCQEFYSAINRRCLIFVLCSNSVGSVIGYISCINNRVVPLLLNRNINPEQLDSLIQSYRPEYIWVPSEDADHFGKYRKVFEKEEYSLFQTDANQPYPLHDDLALLLTTSGSTGSPKLVRQSYANISANTDSIVNYLQLDEGERPITTLPMNYTYGLSIINTHLQVGATILLTDKSLMQKEFWGFFEDQEATSFGGVPYTYEILARLHMERMSLPSLKTMTQAGGKLSENLHEKFARFAAETGRKFVVMYGQCEATARMGYLPPEKAIEKKGSMGIAIPGGRFRLVGEDGEEMHTPYTPGELYYEGKNVTLGYAQSGGDLSKADERDGVLATGDIAQFDDDGFFYIVGRKKRFLKIFGNRVNLDEVERMLKQRFSIDIACAGMDDHMYLFITASGMEEEIRSYISDTTHLNSSAFSVRVIDAIPQNDSGKTEYVKLERYYDV